MIYRIYTSTDDNDLIKPENPTKLVRHKHQIKIKIKVKKNKNYNLCKDAARIKNVCNNQTFQHKTALKTVENPSSHSQSFKQK